MADIVHLVRINASPEAVYEALTTSQGVASWWTREARVDARVGGVGELAFYGGKAVTKLMVVALELEAAVVWRVTSAPAAPGGWEGTTISFRLRRDGGDTVVGFAHEGFAEAGEGRSICSTGWAYYLLSLKRHLEIGAGMPHPDPSDYHPFTAASGKRAA